MHLRLVANGDGHDHEHVYHHEPTAYTVWGPRSHRIHWSHWTAVFTWPPAAAPRSAPARLPNAIRVASETVLLLGWPERCKIVGPCIPVGIQPRPYKGLIFPNFWANLASISLEGAQRTRGPSSGFLSRKTRGRGVRSRASPGGAHPPRR